MEAKETDMEWIDVTVQMPEKGERVILKTKYGIVGGGYVVEVGGNFRFIFREYEDPNRSYLLDTITVVCWKPLKE